jgi:LEA14-like dessication related protein
MKYLKPILVVSGLSIIGYALYNYYKKQIDFLKDISYKITGIRLVTISQGDVTIEVIMDVYNASNVEATITEIFLDFTMNGVKVGSINESQEFVILPTKTSQVRYNFIFNPSLVFKNIVNIATLTLSLKDVKFVADGYIKVKSSFLSTTVPFTYENTLKNLLKK